MEAAVESNAPVFALCVRPGTTPSRRAAWAFASSITPRSRRAPIRRSAGGRVLLDRFRLSPRQRDARTSSAKGLSYVSTHASPAYPGTGYESAALGDDVLVNVPLPASGIATEAFVAIWEQLLERAAAYVRPDLIVASAGFDYVAGDPVGDLGVDVSAASALARAINRTATDAIATGASHMFWRAATTSMRSPSRSRK